MNRDSIPDCILCGSDNVLPFEDDSPAQSDTTLFLVILSAVLVIMGYILFVISSYLFFPLVVFVAIIVTTRLINKQYVDQAKKALLAVPKDYICLDCNGFFKK